MATKKLVEEHAAAPATVTTTTTTNPPLTAIAAAQRQQTDMEDGTEERQQQQQQQQQRREKLTFITGKEVTKWVRRFLRSRGWVSCRKQQQQPQQRHTKMPARTRSTKTASSSSASTDSLGRRKHKVGATARPNSASGEALRSLTNRETTASWTAITSSNNSNDSSRPQPAATASSAAFPVLTYTPAANLFWQDRTYLSSTHRSVALEGNAAYQRLNHFSGTRIISRKDMLATTMALMQTRYGKTVFNFTPTTFVLPKHADKFFKCQARAEALQQKRCNRRDTGSSGLAPDLATATATSKTTGKGSKVLWIFKPGAAARGAGLYLVSSRAEVEKQLEMTRRGDGKAFVLQRYIADPLLIGGYKFDMRLYVLITRFWPLECFLHDKGLVRFGTVKYDPDETANKFAFLTNSSINKASSTLEADKDVIGKGAKWTVQRLFAYLEGRWPEGDGNDNSASGGGLPRCDTAKLWQRIQAVVLLTLVPLIGQIPLAEMNTCYEIFGFDIMLDSRFKPWLLEVNRSPAMAVGTEADKQVKTPMLHDAFNILGMDMYRAPHADESEEGECGRNPSPHVHVPAITEEIPLPLDEKQVDAADMDAARSGAVARCALEQCKALTPSWRHGHFVRLWPPLAVGERMSLSKATAMASLMDTCGVLIPAAIAADRVASRGACGSKEKDGGTQAQTVTMHKVSNAELVRVKGDIVSTVRHRLAQRCVARKRSSAALK